MDEYESLSHTKWDCKYHVVFIPKCRRRTLYEKLRPHLGQVFKSLAQQKESNIVEGHLLADHVHMMIEIPPKYAVSQVVGFIKGKSAIHLARVYGERKRNFVGHHFWARGYFVSTVGRDEALIRDYIRNQEHEDRRLEQLNPDDLPTFIEVDLKELDAGHSIHVSQLVLPKGVEVVTRAARTSASASRVRARSHDIMCGTS